VVLALCGRGVVGPVCIGVLALNLRAYKKGTACGAFFNGELAFSFGLLAPLGYACRVDVAQFPSQQDAYKQQDGKPHTQGQCPCHAARLVALRLSAAQHEEQGCTQAGQNGEKCNGDKYAHGRDYLVSRGVRHLLVGIAAVVAVVLALSLGRWQLDRAAQKEALAQSIRTEGSKAVLTASDILQSTQRGELVHRAVRLQGRWLSERTVYLDNRQMLGRVGFFVFTPLQLADSPAVVLVQRGWAPRNFENRTTLPKVETAAGQVVVDGRMAPPPSKLYEPGPSSAGAIRQNLDLAQFRQETGLPLLQDLSVVQTGAASEGLLREWPEINLGVDKHYGYAVQWFALAALIVVLYAWFQLRPVFIVSKDSHVARQPE
jgi:surfeit locus 1 family protein